MRKKIILMIALCLVSLTAWAANYNVKTTITEPLLNNFFNAVTPLTGKKEVQVGGSPVLVSYTLSNVGVSIVGSTMKFTGNILVKSKGSSLKGGISGVLTAGINSQRNVMMLSLSDFSTSNPTLATTLTALANAGAFNIVYPNVSRGDTYNLAQFGKNKTITAQLVLNSVSVESGALVIYGNEVFK